MRENPSIEGLGPIKCIAIGPAPILSRELAEACNDFTISIINGYYPLSFSIISGLISQFCKYSRIWKPVCIKFQCAGKIQAYSFNIPSPLLKELDVLTIEKSEDTIVQKLSWCTKWWTCTKIVLNLDFVSSWTHITVICCKSFLEVLNMITKLQEHQSKTFNIMPWDSSSWP